MSLDQLTTRQREIYDFIRKRIKAKGYAPTVREIGKEFNIRSPNGVVCNLTALEVKGVIFRDHGLSRAITLAECDDGIPYFPSLVNLTNALNS